MRRDRAAGWLGGVCAGIARRYGIDPALVRLAFVVATAAAGFGVFLYALLWLVIPSGEAKRRRRLATGRGAIEVALGTGLLLLSALLTFRELGIWFSDAIAWPLVLIASGGALIWRGSATSAPARDEPVTAPLVRRETEDGAAAPQVRRAAVAMSRTGVGIALVIAAALVFLQSAGALSAARDVILAVIAVVVVLGAIFAPWIVRLVRSLTEERAQRIRSQERAEMAAHLHDSVLQTLALVQRRSTDPQEVAALARRQERELRAWLSERPAPGKGAALAPALEAAAAEVEERHGVPVEVVVVGERELDSNLEALVAAAREAMTNAAKFGAGSPVDVYAESNSDTVHVYVRDRGPGFDPAALPPDRHGVRESIVGRMERHGGRARIASDPETGTEVELELPARADR
jgi:signal transduction histidine kinase